MKKTGMDSKLKFLTAEDYNLLVEKAKVAIYKKNDTILSEGVSSHSIYVLRRGVARVERAISGKGVAIAMLEPGDIFGEMSFLEDVVTSARIVAEEDVEVFILEKNSLYSLLVSVPGLSARFYQSLAHSLSYRLRSTSSLVSSLMRKLDYQRNFEIRRTTQEGQDNIPPELIGELELFKNNLLEVEQQIRENKISSEEAQEIVNRVCNMLINATREQIIDRTDIEKAIGTYVFRETFPFFMLSSFIDLAFRQPTGTVNDTNVINILSQNEPEGDRYLGIYIDRWIRSIPTCIALKNRGSIITATVKQLANTWNHVTKMPVTSLASGSANEILDLYLNVKPPNVHVTCIDSNHKNLTYAANLSRKLGFSDYLTFIREDIVLLAQGHDSINLPSQQMIYSLSISNYLRDRELIAILNWIYDRLLPNGTVILGNFNSSNPDRILLENILEWDFVYRSAEQLEKLFARTKFRSLPLEIESDEYGVELFAVCTKSWQLGVKC